MNTQNPGLTAIPAAPLVPSSGGVLEASRSGGANQDGGAW